MIRAVFFDFYNTLAHYEPSAEQVQIDTCRELGFTVGFPAMRRAIALADHFFYEENRRFTVAKRPPAEQYQVYFDYEEKLLKEAGLHTPRPFVMQMWDKVQERANKLDFGLFDDALPALQTVRDRGLKAGMISNIPREKLPVLERLGLTAAVDFVVTPSDAGADKPDPAIFRAALAKASVAAAEAMHVGDQYYVDVEGALGAGLKALFLDRCDIMSHVTACPRITGLLQLADHL